MKNTRRRILIIDPDDNIVKEYLSLFENDGYDVENCVGITDAVERMRDVTFDCIIMDVFLPEIKGYEAVHIIKAIDPKVQVIITSADNTMELEARVRKEDIFYYYLKSFDRQELRLVVINAFNKLGKSNKEDRKMNSPAKILVVDDDPDFIKATKAILKSQSYQVDTAYNKSEALDKIKQFGPDLILLDIMMERLDDGFTICYKLKHDPALKHIPVLAISAITEKTGFKFSPKTDGEYFEADDYVEKPIKREELLARIDKLLNR